MSPRPRGLRVVLEFILVLPNHTLFVYDILVSPENITVPEVPCFSSLTIDS